MAQLLSRYAECIFWLGRYMERAENTARVLDVTETFARDREGRNWRAVVQINADEERFFKRHTQADARSVPAFYLLDADNPTSVPFAVRAARENARTIRSRISIEMWQQLNMLYNRTRLIGPESLRRPGLTKLCTDVRHACQEHTGIVEGTLYRDACWSFYILGATLERADQITRLLDIKYHLLLPGVGDVGSALDLSQWNAVLRAAAGYQAFRRVNSGRITPAAVAGFLLHAQFFPRSFAYCLDQLYWTLGQLRSHHGVRGTEVAMECLDELKAVLADKSIDAIIAMGLHEFLDWCQIRLGFVAEAIAERFFRLNTAAPNCEPTAVEA